MLTLRTMVTAFIFNENKLLFMKRATNRKLMPGAWAPIGGHIEPDEINNPMKACLREIEEETGLTTSDLSGISLKYILHRRKMNEIRIQYVFFGESSKTDLADTEEGELFWIDPSSVSHLEASYSIKYVLNHYLSNGKDVQEVLIGTMGNVDGKPIINWGLLQDWE